MAVRWNYARYNGELSDLVSHRIVHSVFLYGAETNLTARKVLEPR